jgi:2-keto-4-pentenoate hydratase/2-oxohepta-3-ene-1,7-dioic acid hydratase in catechol pathway
MGHRIGHLATMHFLPFKNALGKDVSASDVGYSRKPPVFRQSGNIAEVEIEGIGTLVNTVADADR